MPHGLAEERQYSGELNRCSDLRKMSHMTKCTTVSVLKGLEGVKLKTSSHSGRHLANVHGVLIAAW